MKRDHVDGSNAHEWRGGSLGSQKLSRAGCLGGRDVDGVHPVQTELGSPLEGKLYEQGIHSDPGLNRIEVEIVEISFSDALMVGSFASRSDEDARINVCQHRRSLRSSATLLGHLRVELVPGEHRDARCSDLGTLIEQAAT